MANLYYKTRLKMFTYLKHKTAIMRKTMLLLVLSVCTFLGLQAQDSRVTGRVTDAATGNPVELATVIIKGKNKGVTTDANGTFSIAAAKGDVIIISSVGYVKKVLTVGDNTAVTVELNKDDNNLADVVVVGYSTQKKANLTGSVVTLKNADLTRRQVASTSNLLQGLAPGVTVQQQSGKPGADGASIRVRGTSSIFGGSDPLVIVDGVVSSLDNIDPNAIESINLLKDAASTAIYGSRAANGVLLIKTKRGTQKGLRVSYNNFFTKQVATAIPERVDAISHMELSNLAEQNRTGNPAAVLYPQTLIDKYKTTPANNLDVINTDWLDLLLTNTGLMQNHNVQISGGGEKMNMFTSVTYLKQDGLIKNSSFEKYDIRFNPDFKLSDKLTLNGVFAYNNSKTINPSTGSAEFIIRQAIGLPAIGGGKYGPGMYGTAGQTNNRNPLAMAEAAGTSQTLGNTFLSKVGLTFKPIRNLEIEASWARELRTPSTKTFVKNADIYVPNLATQGYDKIGQWPGTTSLGESFSSNVYKTYLAQATYTGKYKDHNFKVMAGGQSELFKNSAVGASRTGFINPNQPYLNLGSGVRDNTASANELALAGFFSRLNYNYREKYFLELNGRYDGSSRFSQARDNQWGFFPSASAGWIFTKETFLSSISDVISYGKIRGSIGSLGNQNLGSLYPFDAFYAASAYNNPNNGTSTYFNNITTLGYALLDMPNADIQWEKSNQWNVGIDLSFTKNITITADYYVRSLSDMILRKPTPGFAGGLSDPFINAGRMENKGWELSVNYKKKVKEWMFDVTAMLSDVKNNVTSLAGNPFLDGGSIRTQEGQSIFSYFGYKAIGYFRDSNAIKTAPVQFGIPFSSNPAVGPKPGDVQYADINGDNKIDANDRTFIGNNFPRLEYSINLNITYKNFDLNIFGQGVGKRDNYLSGTGAVPFNSADFAASLLDIHRDYWTPNNPNATFPRLLPSGSGGNNFVASDKWIRSAAYFRIKNINLGYRIPASILNKAKISSARVFVSAANLFTITKAWNGFDPEINNANAEFYPLMKTFTAGINVNF
jgi:TonB-linked SusC/RagA family outer membrane protein